MGTVRTYPQIYPLLLGDSCVNAECLLALLYSANFRPTFGSKGKNFTEDKIVVFSVSQTFLIAAIFQKS